MGSFSSNVEDNDRTSKNVGLTFASNFDRCKVNLLVYVKLWKQACLPSLLFGAELWTLMHQSIPSTNIPPRATPGVLHSTAAPGPGFILDDLPRGPGFCISIKLRLVQ